MARDRHYLADVGACARISLDELFHSPRNVEMLMHRFENALQCDGFRTLVEEKPTYNRRILGSQF